MLLDQFHDLSEYLEKYVIGQDYLIKRLLITLLSDGHILVEGAPGLAKTKVIKALAMGIECDFQRIQFTPDLLPSDLTGTEVYQQNTGQFELHKGPLFHNFILADEINRAPAKVQSALLEAMAERQITVGQKTIPLSKMFLVMATQNPIEQEGTYPLPEAQLDRFLMKVDVDYPNIETERKILSHDDTYGDAIDPIAKRLSQESVIQARKEVFNVHVADSVKEYIVHLVMATRKPQTYLKGEMVRWIEYGVSPRGSIALQKCTKAHAWLNGKDFASPEDVQSVLYNVFGHRILLSYEAEAQNVTTHQVIDQLINQVVVV